MDLTKSVADLEKIKGQIATLEAEKKDLMSKADALQKQLEELRPQAIGMINAIKNSLNI